MKVYEAARHPSIEENKKDPVGSDLICEVILLYEGYIYEKFWK